MAYFSSATARRKEHTEFFILLLRGLSVSSTSKTDRPPATGIVYFVGAGPGHPGLITVRGVECLQRADVVLYDYLANPLVLSHVNDKTEMLCLGRHRRADVWSQEAINQEMVKRAAAGQCVVRLKGGDPMVFGRAAEEMSALIDAGIAFEIIPGVTTASAAGAFGGVAITDRRHASAIALVTGHERLGKPDSALDYQALANFPGTLVIYMGVRTAANWSTALLEAGKPADTPVLLVRRCSWPDQQKLQTTLGKVADELTPYQKFPPPVVTIIGESARANPGYDWFARLPLLGKGVLVTRPAHQASSMIARLSELGANAILGPSIAISEVVDPAPIDKAIDQLSDYDFLVFSSSNGVHYFLRRLFASGRDARSLAHAKLAVIGPRTAAALREYSLVADVQPDTYRAEALVESLASDAKGKRFLLLRANRGREVLSEQLTEHGGTVQQVVVYESKDVASPDPAIEERWAEIEWVTVTSSAIGRSLHHLWGERLKEKRLVSISPVTSRTLRECGLTPAAEATTYTSAGVIEAILEATNT